MNRIAKMPFETIVLLLVIYYSGIVLFLDPVAFKVKINFIASAFSVLIVFLFFGIAFRGELNKAKNSLFKIFLDGEFSRFSLVTKVSVLLKLSFPVLIVTSFIEFTLSTIFIEGGSVAIGFPLSIYSFSASKFLYFNFIVDLLLQVSVLYLVGYILMKNEKKD